MAIFLSWGEYCARGRRCGISLILPFPRLFCKSGEEIGALLFPRECGIMEKKANKSEESRSVMKKKQPIRVLFICHGSI
jgi:hypothetical protein